MTTSKPMHVPSVRLISLDVLRGLDMFFLVALGPLLNAYHSAWGLPIWLREQLQHVAWEGLTAWDLIMPCFILICGAAIPFALLKLLVNGCASWHYWRHVLKRVMLLWVFGMMVQGNLLSLNPAIISPYNNTLQAIAAGYLIAAGLYLITNRIIRYSVTILLAIGYSVILAQWGDYTPDGNAAILVERLVLPINHDGYGWVLTTLMFGVMTVCGLFCGELLKSEKSALRKLITLISLGCSLLFVGHLLGFWIPPIKRIYTISFTAQAMGWSILILFCLYLVIDVCHVTRGWGLFRLYGRYALMAYLCGTLFWFPLNALARTLTYGTEFWLGSALFPFIQTCASVMLLTGVLYLRTKLSRS